MSAKEIKDELVKRWHDDPAAGLCVAIIDYMLSLPRHELRMLTFQTLSAAAKKDSMDDDFMRALTILVSSRFAALEAHALLVDDDRSEHELTSRELAEARATGHLVHPDTGELVSHFEFKVIPFFVPSARFLAEDP